MDISEAAGTLDEVPRQFPNKVRIRTEVETAAKKPWHDVCLPVRKFYFLSYNEGHLRAYIVVVIDGLEIFFFFIFPNRALISATTDGAVRIFIFFYHHTRSIVMFCTHVSHQYRSSSFVHWVSVLLGTKTYAHAQEYIACLFGMQNNQNYVR